MRLKFENGDTNFIGLVNTALYASFVDEDWKYEQLLAHFGNEMFNKHIVVAQMTEKGYQHSWEIEITFDDQIASKTCYRQNQTFIEVTNGVLNLINYDSLTMSAQFADYDLPDGACKKRMIALENGLYKVDFLQFYNLDEDTYTGVEILNKPDLQINLVLVHDEGEVVKEVFWLEDLELKELKSKWKALGAEDERSYDTKRQEHIQKLQWGKAQIENLATFREIHKFLMDFQSYCGVNHPVHVTVEADKEFMVSVAVLVRLGYPKDFIEWHKSYGGNIYTLSLQSIRTTETIIEDLNDSSLELLIRNNFLIVMSKRNGDYILYDMNGKEPILKQLRFDKLYLEQYFLDKIYKGFYGFSGDAKSGESINPQGLEVSKIFDQYGNYNADSEYIKKYIDAHSTVIDSVCYMDFIKNMIMESFEADCLRYS